MSFIITLEESYEVEAANSAAPGSIILTSSISSKTRSFGDLYLANNSGGIRQ